MPQPGRLQRFALLGRLPRLGRHPPVDDEWPDDAPVVRPEQLAEYPALTDDLRVWIEEVDQTLKKLYHRARILQNQFWRQHVALILGGLVATAIGAVQAAKGGGIALLAAAQAVLTGVLAGLTVVVRSRRAQHGYLDARLKAERIKSEFFLFLAGAGGYESDARVARLRAQVDDIETAEGAA